ncbi:MAG: bifunctional oligoribonuclease/PAP phosphatase NrnA [Spirochaetales bacterium]|nr:bifunctional oligoribonuclease/PAP phosphatase NrnA [Spirochaetales bacterium]
MFEDALALIEKYETIIIHRHRNPDGDAIGSQTGLYNIIKDNYAAKRVYMVGDDCGRYGFIASQPMDGIEDCVYENALAVILDTSARPLISDSRYEKAAATLRIDHHLFVEKIADVEVTDTTYESCAGLVTQLAIESGLVVSRKAASALFAGMVTDSGRFRFDSTSAGTFRRAAFLMDRGIDTDAIYSRLYTSTIEDMKLKAKFIEKIRFTEKSTAYIYTTEKELEELEISAFSASRGYVNTMADLKGVRVWAAFAESEEGILCELRSSGPDINAIAVKYGGGGHKKASGATLKDSESVDAMLHDLDEISDKC